MTGLAVVRNIDSPRALRTAVEVEDFEQEIVDQYALAMAAAGLSDGHVANTRSVIVQFARSLAGPFWAAACEGAGRFFAAQRRLGLRITETAMLDIRDWRPDLGAFGKLHVRHGKGSRGRGPKQRLVPAINGADRVIDW